MDGKHCSRHGSLLRRVGLPAHGRRLLGVALLVLLSAHPAGAEPALIERELPEGSAAERRVWVYYPAERPAGMLPLLLVPPAGTPLIHGIAMTEQDRAEHRPYARAGFVVVSFDITGIPTGSRTFDMAPASKAFMHSAGGLADAKRALDLVSAALPFANRAEVYVAGRGSAGTLALQIAQRLPGVRGCVAFAPITNTPAHLGLWLNAVGVMVPGLQGFIERSSPHAQVSKLRDVPLLLLDAEADSEAAADLESFLRQLDEQGVRYTRIDLPAGSDGDTMLRDGIPRALAWLAQLRATPPAGAGTAPSLTRAAPDLWPQATARQ